MPRPDITLVATRESRSEGGRRRAEKIRAQNMTVRERLAKIAQDEAETIARAYLEALEALDADGNPDHAVRLRAAAGFLAEAFGKPSQAIRHETEPNAKIVYETAWYRPGD
jgi:hypothetical protein